MLSLSTSCQAWIFNATLRENILLGSPMREAWYHQVIEACALTSDLKVKYCLHRFFLSKYYNISNKKVFFSKVLTPVLCVCSASQQRRHDRDWWAWSHLVRWTEAAGEPTSTITLLYSEAAGELTSTFKISPFLFHSFTSRQGEPCKSLVCRCRHLPSRRSPLCCWRQSWSAHLQQVHPGEPSSLSSPVQSSKVMLKNKTVLLVTHGLQFLRQCDRVSFKSSKTEWTCDSNSTIHRWFLWRMVKSQSKELTRSWWAKRLEWKNTQNYFNTFH